MSAVLSDTNIEGHVLWKKKKKKVDRFLQGQIMSSLFSNGHQLISGQRRETPYANQPLLLAKIGELLTVFALNHSLYTITDNKQITKVNVQKRTYPPIETPAATRGIPGLRDLT